MASTNKQSKQKQAKQPQTAAKKDIPGNKMPDKKQKKQKKSNEGSRSSCCPWFFGSMLIFGAIASLIAYDTHALHGGVFEESSVGRVLKQTGALPHVENAWFVSMKYSARGYKWAEANAPTAYEKSKTFLQPYGEFAKDLGITIFNSALKGWECTKTFAAEKTPLALEFIDKYVPGFGQKISDITSNTFKGFCSITSNVWRQSVDFFKTKVFVGSLSPENLGKVFNSTSEQVHTACRWFHEKVDSYAKIQ